MIWLKSGSSQAMTIAFGVAQFGRFGVVDVLVFVVLRCAASDTRLAVLEALTAVMLFVIARSCVVQMFCRRVSVGVFLLGLGRMHGNLVLDVDVTIGGVCSSSSFGMARFTLNFGRWTCRLDVCHFHMRVGHFMFCLQYGRQWRWRW